MQPVINAEALLSPEPRPGPIDGAVVPLIRVRDTANGPLLEWATKAGAVYVVEYSDDNGTTWFSAEHRLRIGGTRMLWVDRGQPETWEKPINKAARRYRVKRL